MSQRNQKLFEKLCQLPPRCLVHFEVKEPKESVKSLRNCTSEHTSKKLVCRCGNDQLFLESYQTIEVKGLIRKREQKHFWAPAYVICLNCEKSVLLFDPREHGWDGELGFNASVVESGELLTVNAAPQLIYVSYSFQNIENYHDLVSDGVEHPENYFDTFAVYISEALVFEYECA